MSSPPCSRRVGPPGLALLICWPLLAPAACGEAPAPRAALSTPAPSAEKDQVEAALQRYAGMTLAMNTAGMAALFAPDGEIVNPGQAPVIGPAAIAHFLAGFADYHVLANQLVSSSTVVHGNEATQVGSYQQRVRTPEGKLVEVSGTFAAAWVRDGTGAWLLRRMATTPAA